jgi:CDP-diacylglycerol--glycerol-3-phosphate 3-phosphatidyltransferase
MTFTGTIGRICMFPLSAIIRACVVLRIHPNILTVTGVFINVLAAWALGLGAFVWGGVIMIAANIFDFIDGKVARELKWESEFGGFWDSVMDRFSDISLFIGLIYLYAEKGRTDYVIVTALAMMFSVMTSYTRARAESIITKCKVGFMERPERIVLFMIGAFTNRMAAVMWVLLVLSIVTVADRIYHTWRELNHSPKIEERLEHRLAEIRLAATPAKGRTTL